MDRSIIYSTEQFRLYDLLQGWRYTLKGQGFSDSDILGAPSNGVAAGFVPTYNSNLTITFGPGRFYSLQAVDTTNYGGSVGTFLAPDSDVILQQGTVESQISTFTMTGLASGQSQYVLVEVAYSTQDTIPSSDPTSGLLTFLNPTTPTSPWLGINNDGLTNTTTRQEIAVLTLKYGTPAVTGLQVPPTVDANNQPLYLVLLTFGQTSITAANVFVAAPSVAPNVPSNYPYAPFVAGLLNSHHSGNAGQAPQIKLASEVQGTLSLGNLPATNTSGTIPTTRPYAGNPNGHVAGNQQDLCLDTTDLILYVCTTTGTALTAVWTGVTPLASNQLFTTSGTYAAPVTGTYLVTLQAGGGGGGGGGGTADTGTVGGGGFGGASGQLVSFVMSLTAGNYSVTINAGGGGGLGGANTGTAGTSGGNGGTTIFFTASAIGGPGGGGGSAEIVIQGGPSFPGSPGGGGGGSGGAGVIADHNGNVGANAIALGAGGGGGSGGYDKTAAFAGGAGGNGSSGYVQIVLLT